MALADRCRNPEFSEINNSEICVTYFSVLAGCRCRISGYEGAH